MKRLDGKVALISGARHRCRDRAANDRGWVTRDVVSVSDTTALADIAMLLETKRIKRAPVVRDGRLAGIVSRANLVRALTTTKSAPLPIGDPGWRADTSECRRGSAGGT